MGFIDKFKREMMGVVGAAAIAGAAVETPDAQAATPTPQEERDSAWDVQDALEVAADREREYNEQLASVERAKRKVEYVQERLDAGKSGADLGDVIAAKQSLATEEAELAMKKRAWEKAVKHAERLGQRAVEASSKGHPRHPEKNYVDIYETGNDFSHEYFKKYGLIEGLGGVWNSDKAPVLQFGTDIKDVDFHADPTAPLARDGSPTGMIAIAESVSGVYTTIEIRDGAVVRYYESDEDGRPKK